MRNWRPTNEELQSTNEELQTAYAELRIAYEEKEIQRREVETLQSRLLQINHMLEDSEKLAAMGSWEWNLDEDRMTWSKGFYAILGLDSDRFPASYEAFIGVIHPDDRSFVERSIQSSIDINTHLEIKHRVRTKDGMERVLLTRTNVIYNNQNRPQKMIGNVLDATLEESLKRELKDKKTELNMRLEYMDSILNSLLNGVYVYDIITGKNKFLNPAYTTITGYTLSDMNSMSEKDFFTLFHPDDQEHVRNHMNKLAHLKKGEVLGLKYRFKHKKGNWIWCYSRDSLLEFDERGKPVSFVGSFLNITKEDEELQKNVELLERSLDLVKNVINSTDMGIIAFRSVREDSKKIIDFEYILVNARACDQLGKDELELTGNRLLTLYPEYKIPLPEDESHSLFDHYCEIVETGSKKEFEIYYGGEGRIERLQNMGVKNGDGFVLTFSSNSER